MQKLRIALGTSIAVIVVWLSALVYFSLFSETRIPESSQDDEKISIVATMYPLAWMASDLDPAAVITTIVGPGVEPHDFSPTIEDVKLMEDAELLLVNRGVDEWAIDVIADRSGPTVSMMEMLGLFEDPHVWLDPILAQRMVEGIGSQLALIDPKRAHIIRENVVKKIALLQGIDDAYRLGLARCQVPEIVSSHDAFGFLARRYGFTVHGIVGFSPESEPSSSRLVELTNLIVSRHITTVFFEELVSDALSRTLARETGARIDVLNPIESPTSADRAELGYPGIMQENLEKLRSAMICQ